MNIIYYKCDMCIYKDIYICGILFSLEKGHLAICNMDEPQGHYAK